MKRSRTLMRRNCANFKLWVSLAQSQQMPLRLAWLGFVRWHNVWCQVSKRHQKSTAQYEFMWQTSKKPSPKRTHHRIKQITKCSRRRVRKKQRKMKTPDCTRTGAEKTRENKTVQCWRRMARRKILSSTEVIFIVWFSVDFVVPVCLRTVAGMGEIVRSKISGSSSNNCFRKEETITLN